VLKPSTVVMAKCEMLYFFPTVASMCKGVCSVTVGGEEIPSMPPEMQLKVTHKF
jgi:hypothetical protein